jgi:molybdopterin converting factor small subunit
MKIRVRLFAVARELARQESIELELPPAATIADVRRGLGTAVPALAPWLAHLRFAIGTEYAVEGAPVGGQREIICIPPVSGG